MGLLVEAGKMSLQAPEDAGPDERAVLLQLRKALVEAFLGIINGIKSPDQEQHLDSSAEVIQHIQSMFFYIQGIVTGSFEVDSPDEARQILDLYTDIVITGFVDGG